MTNSQQLVLRKTPKYAIWMAHFKIPNSPKYAIWMAHFKQHPIDLLAQ